MALVLDTNILLNIVRSKNRARLIRYFNPNKTLMYISVVTEAEIRSLSIRNKWTLKRLNALSEVLEDVQVIEIDQSHVISYAEIDSFSQRLNPNFTNYKFNTPRNMGKNDLWIASLATLLGLTLVTTDSDFDHLNGIFFDVRKIQPVELAEFL